MADREVRTTRCYKCGKTALKRIRWFSGKNRTYYCLAECPEHGYIRGKIRLKKTDAEKIFVELYGKEKLPFDLRGKG